LPKEASAAGYLVDGCELVAFCFVAQFCQLVFRLVPLRD
jgi:hypothetical protein